LYFVLLGLSGPVRGKKNTDGRTTGLEPSSADEETIRRKYKYVGMPLPTLQIKNTNSVTTIELVYCFCTF